MFKYFFQTNGYFLFKKIKKTYRTCIYLYWAQKMNTEMQKTEKIYIFFIFKPRPFIFTFRGAHPQINPTSI